MRLLRKRGRAGGEETKIFFATDAHGSETTFRKFLNAAKFYDVDVLVYGGDLMGKIAVPIVESGAGRHRASLQGTTHELDGPEELARFRKRLDTLGFYSLVCDQDEYDSYAGNQEAIDALFDELARQRLVEWVNLGEERLGGTDVRAYLCGGNDDTPMALSILEEVATDHVLPSENKVLPLDDEHTLASIGYSTPTPWHTPRELPDEEIGKLIEDVLHKVPDPSRCIFNFHTPPLDSSLDTCIKLDASTDPPTPIVEAGEPVYFGAGSKSVREALMQVQPVMGLHGHIHESRGVERYGRTPAFNPGSEYGEGVLRGLIVGVKGGVVTGYQFTSG
jgi:Icc-related predicted phosphoesterase